MATNIFKKNYNIAIFGGGMTGVAASLTAATNGKKVILIERRPLLGWEATSAFNCHFKKSKMQVANRIYQRINGINGLCNSRLDAPTFQVLLDKMVEEAGIELLLYSQPVDLLYKDDLIIGIMIGNKSGEQMIKSKIFVDATEEAILWKQTDMDWIENKIYPAKQTIFFNRAQDGLELPFELGNCNNIKDITLLPSVRQNEVCVEFTIPQYSISSARRKIEPVIRYVREKVPELTSAAVTHAGLEPYPLDVPKALKTKTLKHPQFKNLLASGIWTIPDQRTRDKINTLTGRLELGEKTGRLALEECKNVFDNKKGTSKKNDSNNKNFNIRETDVVVAGGGTAGVMAAISAARQGVKVILLEASTSLGGMVTGGGVCYGGHGVKGGLQDEFTALTEKKYDLYAGNYKVPRYHPDAGKIVFEELCADAGVEVIYGATTIGTKIENNVIKGVFAATPGGKILFKAHTVIDSTGDADVARMAGVPMRTGREKDNILHCYSQSGQIIYAEGRMHPTNFDSGYVDPHDIIDLTRARREGIRQMYDRWQIVDNMAINPLKKRHILTFSPLLGLRQGMQIKGDYEKTMLEQIDNTEYEDCIGYECAKYDCHSRDFENQLDLPVFWNWILGNRERGIGGQTPYRTLLPEGVEGLLVACRSASTTNEANYQFRVIRNMYRIGEAAGIAAAFCVKLDTVPRKLDVKIIQNELYKSGALGEKVKPGPVVKEHKLSELEDMLTSEHPKDAVWLLAQGGEEEIRFLKDFVKNGPLNSRFWAAVALAWHKSEDALPELIKCIEERMGERPDYTPRIRNMVPLWQSAIVILGRIGSKKAIPVLLEVLKDKSIDMDTIIAAIRALGRIGDRSCIATLLKLKTRKDLPCTRRFQVTNIEGVWPVEENALWQIELALAEVLAGFGRPQPDLIERYINDQRNHVRRYAQKVKNI